ncbi:MAG: hypothetical protein ABR529_15745 [Actinomycetota bacterium]
MTEARILGFTGTQVGMPMFPEVVVDISGPDGNAFAIMGVVRRALKDAHRRHEACDQEVDDVLRDMLAEDYDHLLDVAKRYVTIVNR